MWRKELCDLLPGVRHRSLNRTLLLQGIARTQTPMERSKPTSKFRYRPSPTTRTVSTFVFWVVIIAIAIYAFTWEGRHNSCYVDRTQECMSPFYRCYPEPGDTDIDLLKKIKNGTQIGEERVRWRRTLLISFGIIFFTFVITQRRIPRPLEFSIGVIIAFLLIYHVEAYWWMHYGYRVQKNIERSIDQLSVNLGHQQEGKACGLYGPSNTSGSNWLACQRVDDGINRGKTL